MLSKSVSIIIKPCKFIVSVAENIRIILVQKKAIMRNKVIMKKSKCPNCVAELLRKLLTKLFLNFSYVNRYKICRYIV